MTYNEANVTRFSGFADIYDQYRPQPPAVATELLTQYADQGMPRLVVDLGSGTGLSTRIWVGRAREVIGIEPSADMRRAAEAHPTPAGDTVLHYRDGHSAATGLPDGCADIVCCAQAFHWMEPTSTLTEVARILRDGGIFATLDCDWPPTIHWQADAAFRALHHRVRDLEHQHHVYSSVKRWPKEQHLANITASGHFRFTNEVLVHQVEPGSAARLTGLALSFGSIEDLLKLGLSEEEIGITTFRKTVMEVLGERTLPMYFSYRLRIGVK